MKWEVGRQGTGYRKLLLAEGRWWDCYLIDYPPHTHIPTHTDPIPGKRHYRLNILLRGEDNFRGQTLFPGSETYWFPPSRWLAKHIKLFRPDISPHSVEEVSSRRLIFSIGWIR